MNRASIRKTFQINAMCAVIFKAAYSVALAITYAIHRESVWDQGSGCGILSSITFNKREKT